MATYYRTKTGKLYHLKRCRYLRQNDYPVEPDELKFLKPCSSCKPNEIEQKPYAEPRYYAEITKQGKGLWICSKYKDFPTSSDRTRLAGTYEGKWNEHKKCFVFPLLSGLVSGSKIRLTHLNVPHDFSTEDPSIRDKINKMIKQGVKKITLSKPRTANKSNGKQTKQTSKTSVPIAIKLNDKGDRIHISGDTYRHKDLFKKNQGWWAAKQKIWSFSLPNGVKVAEALKIKTIQVKPRHMPAKLLTNQGFNVTIK